MRACQPKDLKRREWRGERGREREKERERKSTRTCERERESALAPPFIYFSSTWACPMQIGLSQECCLFYLKSSLQSLDLLLFYFCWLFPSLSFSHHHFGLLSLFYLTNIPPSRDGRPNSLGKGHRDLSGYFLLNWDDEVYWASPYC